VPGPATILEGRFGLYRTFLNTEPDLRPFQTLGREWEVLRVGYKPYPCCHLNHAYLDCALELRGAPGVSADAIERIECRVPAFPPTSARQPFHLPPLPNLLRCAREYGAGSS